MKQMIGCAIVTILMTSCIPTKSQKVTRQNVVVAIENNAVIFDPRFTTNAVETKISMLLFPGLMTLDENLNLIPYLAKRVTTTDAKTYDIELNRGIRFHDGTELTTEDVRYTLESMSSSELAKTRGVAFGAAFKKIKQYIINDPYKMTIVLDKPLVPFLFELTLGIVPKHLAIHHENFAKHPVGTGPFEFVSLSSDGRIHLRRFELYFGKKALIEQLTFKYVPDNTVQTLELMKGDVHLVFANNDMISWPMLQNLSQNKNLEVNYSKGVSCDYILFNMRNPYFKHKLVRQAIYHAINRDAIINYQLFGHATKTDTFLPPSNWAYEPHVTAYDYNSEKAERLLDMAGFPKKGKYRFTITFKTSMNKNSIERVNAVASDLKKIGIHVDIRSFESTTFLTDIRKGSFELFMFTWPAVIEPDAYFYMFSKESFPPNGANRGFYYNEQLETFIQKSRVEVNREKRKMLFSEIQKIVSDELPMLPLWHLDNAFVIQRNLRGFHSFPTRNYQNMVSMYWGK